MTVPNETLQMTLMLEAHQATDLAEAVILYIPIELRRLVYRQAILTPNLLHFVRISKCPRPVT